MQAERVFIHSVICEVHLNNNKDEKSLLRQQLALITTLFILEWVKLPATHPISVTFQKTLNIEHQYHYHYTTKSNNTHRVCFILDVHILILVNIILSK